ncbi:WSC-domain-containing protein [Myriangium duriaei CBS 260.36]|uniref:WSC-domain-containing protein n=1 Tax=Myriangium duriaei CBS 260.36 TaxID=1168546 RepID=A0A9P4J2W7_9PEZI|nr:WSC-domain-containing protein [Myriangium duriaei CBS 260.36]
MHLSLPTLLLPLLALPFVTADITSAVATTTATDYLAGPTPAASNAVFAPGVLDYQYIGCYNETTQFPGGNRALEDGGMQTNNSQTVEACLTFCHGNGYKFCGIEYGRECWGGRYLSTLSAKLPTSNCSTGCVGNLTQFCGGYLTLTMYNITSTSAKGAGAREVASAIGAVVLAGALGAAFSVF